MTIDFRSDTLTKPTDAMRTSMATAEVGDDVYGEDPTVRRLEETVAGMLAKEAGLFVSSGTQSNLCGIMAHCQRGDEYLVGQQAHTYKHEAGGAAVLGSIQPQPIEMLPDGTFDLDVLESYIKPPQNMFHFARSRLLCLENTHDGKVLPADAVAKTQDLARRHGLRLHLDGARLWNAAVASGVSPAQVAAGFDTVSVCLSKGLGAPVGSVLVGEAALIDEARRWRKMLGGGMRQAGVIAAAGLHAVSHHVERLADDHENARVLAEGLRSIDGLTVSAQNTNMVFCHLDADRDHQKIADALRDRDVVVSAAPTLRLVCHLDISSSDIPVAVEAFEAAFA